METINQVLKLRGTEPARKLVVKVFFKDIKEGSECVIKSGGNLSETIRKTGYNKGVCTSQTGYGNQRGVGHRFTISPYRDVEPCGPVKNQNEVLEARKLAAI